MPETQSKHGLHVRLQHYVTDANLLTRERDDDVFNPTIYPNL